MRPTRVLHKDEDVQDQGQEQETPPTEQTQDQQGAEGRMPWDEDERDEFM